MEFTKPGIIERKLRQLESLVYGQKLELSTWKMWAGVYSGDGEYTQDKESATDISIGGHWICKEHDTRWFSTTFTIPKEFEGQPVVLLLEFGGEGLVRVDGVIRSAITSYLIPCKATRTRVYLTEAAVAGQTYTVEVEAGMNYMEYNQHRCCGVKEMEYTVRSAQAVVLDKQAQAAYFDFVTVFDAMQVLQAPMNTLLSFAPPVHGSQSVIAETNVKDIYLYKKVAEALTAAITMIDFDFTPERMKNTMLEAREELARRLEAIGEKGHAIIRFVGQAHIDTAWLWSVRETIRKTGKTFSNVLALMDKYPEFVFAFSQPQLFEFAKKYYPELYRLVKERVAEGRFELVGNTWVEMDVNIPSGESLVRQLLYGQAFYLKEFNKSSNVFWMPDVFGYTWALPQIIKRSGMRYFFTSKLCNNDTNRFPYSLFQWEGLDGSRVLSYVQRLNYNGDYCPKTIDSIYRRFDEKHLSENLMMTYGYGDGGGGPTFEMLETGARMKEFPGFQRTRCDTSEAFFQEAEHLVPDLPVWNGELYYEFHRGTYSSQAKTKKGNRECELLLRKAEIAAVVAHIRCGAPYPFEKFLESYKLLLINQFHDILPGSSIGIVYERALEEYDDIRSSAGDIIGSSRQALAKTIPHEPGDIILLNNLSWMRNEVTCLEIDAPQNKAQIVDTETGKRYSGWGYSLDDRHYLAFKAEVPSMGYAVYHIENSAGDSVPLLADDALHLQNSFFELELNSDGTIASILDKEAGRQVLASVSNLLRVFEDKPAAETAWNIELEYQNKSWRPEVAAEPKLMVNTPLKAVVRTEYAFNHSRFIQDMVMYADSRCIDFETTVEWHETEKMLKVEFYPDVRSTKATYEIQFGAIERPNHWNTAFDKARFEACAHKWADLSEGDYGVAVLNNCKYGYDVKENRMRLTLLRAPIDPDPNSDRGNHTFTYSLLPHCHSWQTGGVVQAGYELNVPLDVFRCTEAEAGNSPRRHSFAQVNTENVVIDTVKKAENGEGGIMRLYESSGTTTNVTVAVGQPLNRVVECNLMEVDEKALVHEDASFAFTIKPFEIKTFRIR